jgi:thioredoxin-dependent peroxiredoxin
MVEAIGFRDEFETFRERSIQIVGASADSEKANGRFKEKRNLPFRLLCDNEARDLCTAFGVWQEKKMAGRKYMGVVRSSFLIDSAGSVEIAFPEVKTKSHAQDVLAAVDGRG